MNGWLSHVKTNDSLAKPQRPWDRDQMLQHWRNDAKVKKKKNALNENTSHRSSITVQRERAFDLANPGWSACVTRGEGPQKLLINRAKLVSAVASLSPGRVFRTTWHLNPGQRVWKWREKAELFPRERESKYNVGRCTDRYRDSSQLLRPYENDVVKYEVAHGDDVRTEDPPWPLVILINQPFSPWCRSFLPAALLKRPSRRANERASDQESESSPNRI